MSTIIGSAGPVTITRRSDGTTMIEFAKSGPACIVIGTGGWRALADAVHRAVTTERAGTRHEG